MKQRRRKTEVTSVLHEWNSHLLVCAAGDQSLESAAWDSQNVWDCGHTRAVHVVLRDESSRNQRLFAAVAISGVIIAKPFGRGSIGGYHYGLVLYEDLHWREQMRKTYSEYIMDVTRDSFKKWAIQSPETGIDRNQYFYLSIDVMEANTECDHFEVFL